MTENLNDITVGPFECVHFLEGMGHHREPLAGARNWPGGAEPTGSILMRELLTWRQVRLAQCFLRGIEEGAFDVSRTELLLYRVHLS